MTIKNRHGKRLSYNKKINNKSNKSKRKKQKGGAKFQKCEETVKPTLGLNDNATIDAYQKKAMRKFMFRPENSKYLLVKS